MIRYGYKYEYEIVLDPDKTLSIGLGNMYFVLLNLAFIASILAAATEAAACNVERL